MSEPKWLEKFRRDSFEMSELNNSRRYKRGPTIKRLGEILEAIANGVSHPYGIAKETGKKIAALYDYTNEMAELGLIKDKPKKTGRIIQGKPQIKHRYQLTETGDMVLEIYRRLIKIS